MTDPSLLATLAGLKSIALSQPRRYFCYTRAYLSLDFGKSVQHAVLPKTDSLRSIYQGAVSRRLTAYDLSGSRESPKHRLRRRTTAHATAVTTLPALVKAWTASAQIAQAAGLPGRKSKPRVTSQHAALGREPVFANRNQPAFRTTRGSRGLNIPAGSRLEASAVASRVSETSADSPSADRAAVTEVRSGAPQPGKRRQVRLGLPSPHCS